MKPLLLVDDSYTVRTELRAELIALGFVMTVCDSLASARRALRTHSYSLIILDVLLPDGSGIDLLREIKSAKDKKPAPVILLSSEADVKHRLLGISAGADAYVGKPFDRDYVLKRACELTRGADTTPGSSDRASSTGKKILVADASEGFRYRVGKVLRRDHHDVVLAESTEEALSLLAAEHIDCIMLDLNMPRLGGLEMIRAIRRIPGYQRVPIMVLAADYDEESRTSCLIAGADEFVLKSPQLDLLKVDLRALLRRKWTDLDTTTPSSHRQRACGTLWETQTDLPQESLLYQVVQSSGLSGVIGPSTIVRACNRVDIDAKKMSPKDLVRALPALRDALRTFFTPEETDERMDALARLARQANRVSEARSRAI